MKKSPQIRNLLSWNVIKENSLPSNIVYGKAIYDRNAVEIIESTSLHIEAWVGGLTGKVIEGGGSKRRVIFTLSEDELKWNCTGNPKDHQIFCKHCIALALELLKPINSILST